MAADGVRTGFAVDGDDVLRVRREPFVHVLCAAVVRPAVGTDTAISQTHVARARARERAALWPFAPRKRP